MANADDFDIESVEILVGSQRGGAIIFRKRSRNF